MACGLSGDRSTRREPHQRTAGRRMPPHTSPGHARSSGGSCACTAHRSRCATGPASGVLADVPRSGKALCCPGCVPYTERHRALVYSCASGRKRSCRTLLVAEPRFNVFGIIPKMASYSARFRADTEVPPLVKGGFGNLQVGRRFLGGPQPVLNRFHKCITPPFDHVGLSDGSCELFLVAGASSRGEGRLGACGGGVPGAVVGPGLEDQDHGVVQRASPRVTFTVGAALALAVLGTGAAQVT